MSTDVGKWRYVSTKTMSVRRQSPGNKKAPEIFTQIENRYGKDVLQMVRNWESDAMKDMLAQERVSHLRGCQASGVQPRDMAPPVRPQNRSNLGCRLERTRKKGAVAAFVAEAERKAVAAKLRSVRRRDAVAALVREPDLQALTLVILERVECEQMRIREAFATDLAEQIRAERSEVKQKLQNLHLDGMG